MVTLFFLCCHSSCLEAVSPRLQLLANPLQIFLQVIWSVCIRFLVVHYLPAAPLRPAAGCQGYRRLCLSTPGEPTTFTLGSHSNQEWWVHHSLVLGKVKATASGPVFDIRHGGVYDDTQGSQGHGSHRVSAVSYILTSSHVGVTHFLVCSCFLRKWH